jgi:VWFA-related protein
MAARLSLCALPLLTFIGPGSLAQSTTLSFNVRVISIDAVVRDSRGNLIPNLNKDDFTLREDNHPVPIRYFSHDNNLPLTIGLLVDTSASQRDYAEEERRASATFLATMLTSPRDRAFVERFDTLAVLLQPMTSDLHALEVSLNLLTAPLPKPKFSKAGTLLYDAIRATAQKVVTHQPGRRAIVILTDGDDDGSTTTLADAIRESQLANLAVYSVLYTPESRGRSSSDPAGVSTMRQLSNSTGGSLFIVTPGVPIAQIFSSIAEDLRSQYRLGFTPSAAASGTFHPLKLESTHPFLTVEGRTGYYTPQ